MTMKAIQKPLLSYLSLLLILVFLFFLSSAFVTVDKEANRILDKVSRNYKSYKSIKAAFKIKILNKQDKSAQTEKGTLFVKGKKFKVEMDGQDIYCDGKTMWTYLKDANEVQISTYNPKNNDINPSEIFTVYEKGFLSKFIGEGKKETSLPNISNLPLPTKRNRFLKLSLPLIK